MGEECPRRMIFYVAQILDIRVASTVGKMSECGRVVYRGLKNPYREATQREVGGMCSVPMKKTAEYH